MTVNAMYPENGIFLIKPIIGGKMLTIEIGTGSALSIVSLNDYSCLFSGYGLRRTNIVINTDTGEKIVPIGSIQLDVTLNIITRVSLNCLLYVMVLFRYLVGNGSKCFNVV